MFKEQRVQINLFAFPRSDKTKTSAQAFYHVCLIYMHAKQ